MPDLCCEQWTKFSAQASCGEQDGGYSAQIPDGLHVHSNGDREQNSVMHHVRGTRSGVVISFLCARNGGYEDLTKEIVRHVEAYGFLNPIIIQCDKEMSIIDVCRKVARERNARTVLRFAPKTSHQRNGFVAAVHGYSQGLPRCYQTQKSRRTLAYSFQQSHLPFHLQFVTLDLCSQDSQCDPTAERHSKKCLELHMCHLCACLVNRYSR